MDGYEAIGRQAGTEGSGGMSVFFIVFHLRVSAVSSLIAIYPFSSLSPDTYSQDIVSRLQFTSWIPALWAYQCKKYRFFTKFQGVSSLDLGTFDCIQCTDLTVGAST